MVKNRLHELHAASKHAPDTDSDDADVEQPLNSANGIKMKSLKGKGSKASGDEHSGDFQAFLDRMAEANQRIDRIAGNVELLSTRQSKELAATYKDESNESAMNDLMEENKRLAAQVRNVLKSEQEDIEKQMASPTKRKVAENKKVELRIRKTQIGTTSNRFYKIWNEYNDNQMGYRDNTKKQLIKRCKITNNSFTDDQIENMLDEGNTDVFARSILDEERLARQQLSELQDRHDELIKLEKSIKEVHDMFLDVATLITQQGEMLDNIQMHIESASTDVERGKGHLTEAEKLQKSARKKKICLFSVLGVVVLIVIIVILVEFGAFSSSGSSNQPTIIYVTPAPPMETTTTPSTTPSTSTATPFASSSTLPPP